jgi:hypothetical protein
VAHSFVNIRFAARGTSPRSWFPARGIRPDWHPARLAAWAAEILTNNASPLESDLYYEPPQCVGEQLHHPSCLLWVRPDIIMFVLPQDVTLTLDPPGTEVQARLVRLTREVAADRIDGQWWNIGGSKTTREAEGDHSWRWRRIIGALRVRANSEALAIETDDGAIQGAIVYRIDARSQLEPGQGAVYGDWLATAPRNRHWLVNPPYLRGVGKALLLAAVRHSYLLGLGGRVWLTSLPSERTQRFYVNRGFQVIFENPDGTIDYELPAAQAVAWLEEEGYFS